MSTPRKGQSRPATGRPRKIAGRGQEQETVAEETVVEDSVLEDSLVEDSVVEERGAPAPSLETTAPSYDLDPGRRHRGPRRGRHR